MNHQKVSVKACKSETELDFRPTARPSVSTQLAVVGVRFHIAARVNDSTDLH